MQVKIECTAQIVEVKEIGNGIPRNQGANFVATGFKPVIGVVESLGKSPEAFKNN